VSCGLERDELQVLSRDSGHKGDSHSDSICYHLVRFQPVLSLIIHKPQPLHLNHPRSNCGEEEFRTKALNLQEAEETLSRWKLQTAFSFCYSYFVSLFPCLLLSGSSLLLGCHEEKKKHEEKHKKLFLTIAAGETQIFVSCVTLPPFFFRFYFNFLFLKSV
jgi:hypothetical protein